jgi:PAS domain S-box-containing protein
MAEMNATPRAHADGDERLALLDESLALLDALWKSAPIGLAFVDAELRYIRVNDALAAIHGVPAAAHVGRTVAEIVPSIGARNLENLRRVIETGQPILDTEVTLEEPAPHGRPGCWSVSYYPVELHDKTFGVGIVVQDITERRRAEQALAHSRLLLDVALAAARCGWFDWDLVTGKIVASRELEALYGIPPGAFAGNIDAWRRLLHPDDLVEAADVALPRAFTTGEYVKDFRVVWPNGAIRWLRARARVLRDTEGRPVRMVGAHLDITDLKQTEGELRANEAERARLLKQAEEAVRARDVFLAVASHELRTPLTPLQLNLQILDRDLDGRPESERLARRVKVALRQTERLAQLCENMLDVARGTMGWRVTVEPREVDVAELVGGVAARFAREAERAKSTIELRLSSPATACLDPVQIELVVASLLSNAVKYGAGKPIEVSVERGPASIRIAVRDHGMGVAPGEQERIFGLFARAVSERRYGGLGLGLYIAKQIVDAHGGRITCASEPGAGATFEVELPVGGPARASAASPAAGAAGPLDPGEEDV